MDSKIVDLYNESIARAATRTTGRANGSVKCAANAIGNVAFFPLLLCCYASPSGDWSMRAVLRCVALRCAVLWYVVLRCVVWCYVMLCCVVLRVLRCVVWCYVVLCCVCCVALCGVMLCCVACVALRCVVLCCVVLRCGVVFSQGRSCPPLSGADDPSHGGSHFLVLAEYLTCAAFCVLRGVLVGLGYDVS